MVFPSGSEIGLEINNALKYSTHFEVFGLTSVRNHSEYVYSNCIEGISYYNSDTFINEINSIISEYSIDYIYPAYDDVQLYLMQNKDRINAQIISADLFTTEICRSKMRTYKLFSEYCFVPKVFEPEEVAEYPVFLKPDIGQGSSGVVKAKNKEQMLTALENNPGLIICEYLPGEEYTIDCFTGLDGTIKCMKMRNRKRIRTGISVCSEILESDKAIWEIANILNDKLNFKGAWFFQVKKDSNDNYKLLEAAPRIAGTMGITRNSGTNYPLMTLFLFEGIDVDVIHNNYHIEVDRAFISRYKIDIKYNTVFVDFDDTMYINNKVNSFLMMYLYQAKSNQKKIVLLSRHRKDIIESLSSFCICKELFDEIIILKENEKKSDYVTEDAIFIDDSFSERLDVSQKKNIPVFDCSEVEALIDWRI